MVQPQKSTLSNGARVLTERHSSTPAVYVGFWILTGTRDESARQAGISHFLEHLVFKGTKKRTTYDIAYALESVGGDINAYTTKEYTCFHTTSLQEHLDLSLDVLADVVFSPTFPMKEFEKEKQVVLQEISMSKEEYGEYIFDVYLRESFAGHATGQPILGTEKTVASLSREDLKKYSKDRYVAKNLLVTVVGDIDHEEVVRSLEKRLRKIPQKGRAKRRTAPRVETVNTTVHAPSEQVHMLYGFPTSSYEDADRYESYFMSTLLGGGMTSKLYQELREKRGLAYSIYSYLYTFADFAHSFVYVATDSSKIKQVDRILRAQMKKLLDKGISRRDLELYRTQMKGHILLSVDDVESRMSTLAHNEMIFGRHRPVDEVVQQIEGISVASVNKYIRKYLKMNRLGQVVLGDL